MASESADSMAEQLSQLRADFAQLQSELRLLQSENLQSEFRKLQCAHRSLVRKVRASGAGVLAISCICLLSNSLPTAFAQGYGTTLRSILQRITALETAQTATTANLSSLNSSVASLDTKTKYLTTGVDSNGYPASYFTACNVYIQDGLGSTSGVASNPNLANDIFGIDRRGSTLPVTNGLGNLIIGYNEPDRFNPNQYYTGSHNLIIGGGNSYSSIGAIVGGLDNYSGAPFASMLSGIRNAAEGFSGAILSGRTNMITGSLTSNEYPTGGVAAAICGGELNTASAQASTVCGGVYNQATAGASTVSGGLRNVASGNQSAVSGGDSITVSDLDGWAGGTYHTP